MKTENHSWKGALLGLGVLLALASTFGLCAEPSKFMDVSAIMESETNVSNEQSNVSSQALTNVSGLSATNAMDLLDEKHILAIGDRLSFRIEEDEEESKPLIVTDSGDLEVPYIGRFPAENKTCRQLARGIKSALEKEYYYQATVIIAVDLMAKSRGKVYLVGPVRAPGPQDIPSDEVFTLSKAILRAGGFTDFADKHNVKVTRKAKGAGAVDKSFTVNVAEILEKGKTDSDLTLEAGDLIYVPERMIRF
jgi:protein involved in polysaccharide export with SLBB domain